MKGGILAVAAFLLYWWFWLVFLSDAAIRSALSVLGHNFRSLPIEVLDRAYLGMQGLLITTLIAVVFAFGSMLSRKA